MNATGLEPWLLVARLQLTPPQLKLLETTLGITPPSWRNASTPSEEWVALTERAGLKPEAKAGEQERWYNVGDYVLVARNHRLLKLYFRQEGQPDRSSWHYLEEMRWMRRHYRRTR